MNRVDSSITYFAEEGKGNLDDCLRLSFETLVQFGLDKLVIFTGVGEGIEKAISDFISQPEYTNVKIIGVTFAQGFEIRENGKVLGLHQFPKDLKETLSAMRIPVVRAHLPFDSIAPQYQQHGVLAQDMGIVGNALNIFCGSMSLCVQAVLLACDAGEVEIGEHVVVMTSDTSLIVRAAPTARFLQDLIVRQIICKPAFLTVAKSEKALDVGEPGEDPLIIEGNSDSLGLTSPEDAGQ